MREISRHSDEQHGHHAIRLKRSMAVDVLQTEHLPGHHPAPIGHKLIILENTKVGIVMESG